MAHDVLAAKLELSRLDVEEALAQVGVADEVVSARLLEGGLLNSNYGVEVASGRRLLLRCYPEARDMGEIGFEVEVVARLNAANFKTPALVSETVGIIKKRPFVVMDYIDGSTLAEADLSDSLSSMAGELQAELHNCLDGFKPSSVKPRHDVAYIRSLIAESVDAVDANSAETLTALVARVWDEVGSQEEWGPPTGVVHADFYVENLIRVGDGSLFVIDFDDSYYGTQMFDAAIGAMEFSALDTGLFSLDRYAIFLNAYNAWRVGGGVIDKSQLRSALLLNCVRFLCYTAPLTLEDGMGLEDNPYALRIHQLLSMPDDLGLVVR